MHRARVPGAMTVRLLAAAALALCACASPRLHAQLAPEPAAAAAPPEASTGFTRKPGWATRHFAVAAANPLAAEAGARVLRAGGNAVDAAVAVQMVLALVEPSATSIAGGAFLLYFDGKAVVAYDGRETAPAADDETLFLGPDGRPMPFMQAVVGGRSVGIPGAVRMLEMAHRAHGRLPWASLFGDAIRLAEEGFALSPRQQALAGNDAALRTDPQAAAYFLQPDGRPRETGSLVKNPDLAYVLRKIAAHGSKGLLEGEVARAIVRKIVSHPTNPGAMTLRDLAGYRAKKREPLCHDFAAARVYRVCGFPPPGSGAIAIGQILGMLANTPARDLGLVDGPEGPVPGASFLHLYLEASRLAFADRAQYVGDPDFVEAPGGDWMSLLAPRYLASRAKLIDTGPDGKSLGVALPGTPGSITTSFAPMPEQEEHGTSHISIVDAQGRAVAMTTTVESAFGSRQMVNVSGRPGGFLLNNQLTDFSFVPRDAQGRPVANRVQPGKRPRSSMAPTLVFDKATGDLVMSIGSGGGPMIVHSVARAIYGSLVWGLDMQRALDLPNFASFNGPSVLEAGRFPLDVVDVLRKRGAPVREQPLNTGTHGIRRTPDGYFGGADPRREGSVAGD